MKHLNQFISEKLKINKDTKVKNKFSEEECIVVPFSKTYDEFFDDFSDYEIMSDSGPNIFVVRIDCLGEYTKRSKKEIDFMKIPDKYSSFEELKDDYEKGILDLDELEKLEL